MTMAPPEGAIVQGRSAGQNFLDCEDLRQSFRKFCILVGVVDRLIHHIVYSSFI
jgi:hypothetical protein